MMVLFHVKRSKEVFLQTEVTAMGSLLGQLKLVVTAVLAYVGDICTTIAAQPILLLTMGILLIGGAIGIFGRLLSRG
jgi:hypothetical protein